ncbi:EamA family transporter [Thermanaerosceptrum fracticalcis]|uniref:EamA family transporter n=1 Tax=Thermanaerosceptrum fracticalcis TaxID=1712410 RepID=A0A7G6E2X7_THEFR|nr:DMT family transporter [Thermanaerosceptrum fracticalcis]QNB46431.1 EamA family transporter [Thermanaerosceptrum fracticalcis]
MIKSPHLLLVLATLFWGGNIALGRAVTGSIPPLTLSYLRWTEAFLIFLPLAWRELKEHKDILLANWPAFAALGLTGILGFNMCVYLAVQYTTATNTALINSFSPVTVILFSFIFLKERITLRQLGGIIFSFAGVVLIIARGKWENLIGLTFNKGDLIMLVAVLLWAVYSMVLKLKGRLAPSKAVFAASILGGLIFTTPLIIYENYQGGIEWIRNLAPYHYLSLLYFGIFPTIVSFLFFNKAMLELGPNRANIYQNLVVVFASLFGIIFLQEKLIYAHLLGGVLIITGVYLTSQMGKAQADKITVKY